MVGRRRGRTGRGWDAAPPRARAPRAGQPGSRPEAGGQSGRAEAAGQGGRAEAAGQGGSWPEDAGPDRSAGPVSPAERAREICLRQLAIRPRTRAELATALRRHGIADEVAAEVLDRYSEVGLIDDAAFARAWVTSRHHSRGLARRALGSELRRRGVAAEAVGEALAELDGQTEAETARALVVRKLRTTRGEPAAVVRRLVGMLARKGYPAGLAYRVVKEVLAEDERTAELAEQLDPDALADAVDATDPDHAADAGHATDADHATDPGLTTGSSTDDIDSTLA